MSGEKMDEKLVARGFTLLLIGAVSVALSLSRDLGYFALLLAALMVSTVLLGRYLIEGRWR